MNMAWIAEYPLLVLGHLQVLDRLQVHEAMSHTVIAIATFASFALLQYLPQGYDRIAIRNDAGGDIQWLRMHASLRRAYE